MALYQRLYEKIYFPLFEGSIKKRETARLYKSLRKSEFALSEDITKAQTAALKKLLTHAQAQSSFHRLRFHQAGFDPDHVKQIGDLAKLPAMTKSDIRENYSDIVCNGFSLWTKSTGGSTGEPLHFAYTKESYEWRVAVSKRGYVWGGALPGTKQAYIWGGALNDVSKIQKLKEYVHHQVDRHTYFNCFNFDTEAMAKCLFKLNRVKPDVIIGYTNPLYELASFVRSHDLKFHPKAIICAAEAVMPHQRETMEQTFGTRVFNTYGSREFMLIAAECEKHEGLHVSAENLIVEIIKEDGTPAGEGETGRILVTDLHNYGMPFIRYDIGDLGVATTKVCSCGRGLPLIADVVGRTLDVIRTPEGMKVAGEFFPHLFKDFREIRRFQVIQDHLDHILVKVVPAVSEPGPDIEKVILSRVQNQMGPRMRVEVKLVSDIPLTATGKFRVTISHLTGGIS